MRRVLASALISIASTAAFAQSLSRSDLVGVVNSSIIDNVQNLVTPRVARNTLLDILNNAAILSDTNLFTGAVTFSANPKLASCAGFPFSTGGSPFSCIPSIGSPNMAVGAAAANLGLVSITASPYNADPTGNLDAAPAITAASASGARVVYVPSGSFKVCGATLSTTFLQTIRGNGNASKIVQGNCGLPAFQWDHSTITYSEQTVEYLSFDSTLGAAHTIDARGAGGLTIRNLYFNNSPAGFDNIFVDGIGVAVHDVRVQNIQVYSFGGSPAGKAMVEFGSLAVDSDLDNLVGNGAFVTHYGVYMNTGAATLRFIHNHPYNVTVNAIFGSCLSCQFVGDTWDNSSSGDVASFTNLQNSTFNGEFFESINTGKNGITLAGNSQANTFVGTTFITFNSEVANFAVNETAGSDYNTFLGGSVSGLVSYTLPIFSFSGVHSYVKSVGGVNNLGEILPLVGATSAAQAGNTTVFLGANGANAARDSTSFPGPFAGVVKSASIATNPAVSGGSLVLTLEVNGNPIGTCTAIIGSFGCNITATTNTMSAGDQIDIKSANPAGGGAVNIRYSIIVSG